MAGGGGNKKRYQYCTDSSGTIVYFRALQGHSGCNLIDPTLQDNVIYSKATSSSTFIMSDVQSIYIPSSSIREWYWEVKILNNRQTVFFLPVDPMDRNHKDPDTIDLSVPRHAQYMHTAWKRHQDAVYWVDINLAIEERIEVLSDSIERYHSS